jgi:hypothetical protein
VEEEARSWWSDRARRWRFQWIDRYEDSIVKIDTIKSRFRLHRRERYHEEMKEMVMIEYRLMIEKDAYRYLTGI